MATQKQGCDRNEDPITGTPGAHPVAAGIGTAAGGAAAGMAAGAVAGPIGAAVGAVVGGVAGGLAGSAVGEQFDPTVEDTYWRESYTTRPYYSDDMTYEEIAPAYRHGWESRGRYSDSNFEDVETSLKESWDETEHDARLGWDKARLAARDAWDHAAVRRPR